MAQIIDLASITSQRLIETNELFKKRSSRFSPVFQVPPIEALRQILEVLFYSSLKTEEGRPIQVRVYYIDPDSPDPIPPQRIRSDRWQTFALENRIALTSANLVKFAKAADPWATGVAIFYTEAEGPYIWGLVDQILHFSTTVVQEIEGTYTQAGVFHASINGPADITVVRDTTFIARLAQDLLITEQNDCLSSGPISDLIDSWVDPLSRRIFRLAGKELTSEWGKPFWRKAAKDTWIRTLSRLLIHIQRQRHGGAILISPDLANKDLKIKHKLRYPRLPEGLLRDLYFRMLLRSAHDKREYRDIDSRMRKSIPRDLYADLVVTESECEDAEEMMSGAVRFVSSLAGIDGLILASGDLAVRGFGAIICTEAEVSEVNIASAPALDNLVIANPNRYGTRHGSMIKYCAANPGSVGFVVSQDGDIRAITRVGEACIVFENVKVHGLKVHVSNEPKALYKGLARKYKLLRG